LNFNLWYLRHPPWDTGISPPELMDFIQSHAPGRALDLGCGSGTNVLTLIQHGWQATGVDFVPAAIARASRRIRAAGVTADLRVGDVTDLRDLKAPFDLILDIGCFHSLDRAGRDAYRRNVQRLLSPGGSVLMYAFLNRAGDPGRTGLALADMQAFNHFLSLVERRDGKERDRVASTWLLWKMLARPEEERSHD
jgi:cyclopropane fatty-acyl-phospholipid synthase-like methyltransferase